jgi:hypothetical protein
VQFLVSYSDQSVQVATVSTGIDCRSPSVVCHGASSKYCVMSGRREQKWVVGQMCTETLLAL